MLFTKCSNKLLFFYDLNLPSTKIGLSLAHQFPNHQLVKDFPQVPSKWQKQNFNRIIHPYIHFACSYLSNIATYDKPVLDLNYSMAVAMLQAPTRLHQSCKHLTFHLMAHHEELLGPSTQASDIEVVTL